MFPDLRRDVVFPIAGSVILFTLVVASGLVYQSQFGGVGERLITMALIDAIIVLGMQVFIGNTGILSFGHIGFGAIAGYAFAVSAISPVEKMKRIPDAPFGLTDVNVDPLLAVLIALAATLVVALVVGLGLARSGAESGAVSATVITLALLFVTHEVARNWPAVTGGDRAGLSFRIGGTLNGRVAIYVALFLAILVARLYAQSRGGRLAVQTRRRRRSRALPRFVAS